MEHTNIEEATVYASLQALIDLCNKATQKEKEKEGWHQKIANQVENAAAEIQGKNNG